MQVLVEGLNFVSWLNSLLNGVLHIMILIDITQFDWIWVMSFFLMGRSMITLVLLIRMYKFLYCLQVVLWNFAVGDMDPRSSALCRDEQQSCCAACGQGGEISPHS